MPNQTDSPFRATKTYRASGKCIVAALVLSSATVLQTQAADFDLAAKATNELGVDLHRKLATGDENLCLSPYSIQSALGMTFAGAEADTRSEMAQTLHYPNEDVAIHASFASLRQALDEMAKKTATIAQNSKKNGGPSDPITLTVANRLFAQSGYDFRDAFRTLVDRYYGAPLEAMDFKKNAENARRHINKWVADQTRDRIRDLIPPGSLNDTTRLVLANALYLKAPWLSEFSDTATKPLPFHIHGTSVVDVPTMNRLSHFGYARKDGFTAVSVSYSGNELQFLILLPNETNGLKGLESKLTGDLLKQCAQLDASNEIDLYLPKFKFQPATMPLAKFLQELGMKKAFDQPPGSANFDRIAPRKPDDYLSVSEVFHKTFISVDEKGTEAAAATAVTMYATAARPTEKPKPIEVKVDHPFFYAIQHIPSGACLFIGRVTDPR